MFYHLDAITLIQSKFIGNYNEKLLYFELKRIKEIVKYILTEEYNKQTKNKTFNAMFAFQARMMKFFLQRISKTDERFTRKSKT